MNGLTLILIVCIPIFLLTLGLVIAAKLGEKVAGYFIAFSFLSLIVFENQIINFLLHF